MQAARGGAAGRGARAARHRLSLRRRRRHAVQARRVRGTAEWHLIDERRRCVNRREAQFCYAVLPGWRAFNGARRGANSAVHKAHSSPSAVAVAPVPARCCRARRRPCAQRAANPVGRGSSNKIRVPAASCPICYYRKHRGQAKCQRPVQGRGRGQADICHHLEGPLLFACPGSCALSRAWLRSWLICSLECTAGRTFNRLTIGVSSPSPKDKIPLSSEQTHRLIGQFGGE